MTQETVRAEEIFSKVTRLKENLAELKESKDMLYDEQPNGMAYKLVKAAYDEASQELNIFKRTRFVEYVEEEKGLDF